MKYQIEWCEKKVSSSGNEYYRATVKDENEVIRENVAIFSSFKNYTDIQAGRTVEGKLNEKDYKGSPSYTLENEVATPIRRSLTAINQAMEKKDQSITKFQGNKEQSIKVASTMSMAVNTAIAFLQGETIKDVGVFKSQVEKWREFYWLEWDKEDKDFPAF